MVVAARWLEAAPRWLVAGVGAIAGGLIAGWVALNAGVLTGVALVVAVGVAFAALKSFWVLVGSTFAIATVLPFATGGISTGPVTPTLLELALLATIGISIALVLADRTSSVEPSWGMALWFVFGGYLVVAFLLGLGNGYTTQTLHDFFKFGLGFLFFWVVIQFAVTFSAVANIVRWMVAGITAFAAIGLLLYAGGASFSLRVLARLIPYGYPSGRIVRYIEDDPARPMRLVSTGVDPNAAGGMLMIGLVIVVSQLVVRNRIIPFRLALASSGIIGVATLLTYSRGAWVGAAVGIGLVLLIRSRVLLIPLGVAATGLLALGVGSGFAHRLWLGFTLQDPATKLRLREYGNAWEIIQAHPWFGVGFGDAPSIELQTGVSSTYLVIAERAGLIGLALFLIVVIVILGAALRAFWIRPKGEIADTLLSVGAAFVAALTVGLVDHYYFNVQYVHMTVVFWTLAGLLVVLSRLSQESAEGITS